MLCVLDFFERPIEIRCELQHKVRLALRARGSIDPRFSTHLTDGVRKLAFSCYGHEQRSFVVFTGTAWIREDGIHRCIRSLPR